MSKLSGIKDLDREILSKLDNRELLKACSIDKYTWNTVCDDAFLKRRLLSQYPEIENYKGKEETWKQFFLRSIHYIALMKENFDYEYNFGDFFGQYKLLKEYNEHKNELLTESAEKGELALVIWSLKKGADIHSKDDMALREASEKGHLEIVKYLVENGADIHSQDDYPLRWASTRGHLEIVKYLVKQGADIHSKNDFALIWSSSRGHLEVVKFLMESGADIYAQNDLALLSATQNGRLKVAEYLKFKMYKNEN